jgi:hypothetical protein
MRAVALVLSLLVYATVMAEEKGEFILADLSGRRTIPDFMPGHRFPMIRDF